MVTLEVQNVPVSHREHFIISGYRPVPTTLKRALWSAFEPHNELLNFWTHFIPGVFMAFKFLNFITTSEEEKTPMALFQFTIMALFMTSSFAHLLNCMSFRARHVCFACDYSSIVYYTIAGSMLQGACIFPDSFWADSLVGPTTYIGLSIIVGFFTVWVSCFTRLPQIRNKYLYRTLCFVLPFVTVQYPIFKFMASKNVSYQSVLLFKLHCFANFIGAFCFNVTKVPERLAPGIFDLIGHSHHFMHIGTTVGVYAHYYLVEIEFQKYSKSRYSPLHILSIFFIVTVIFILYLRRFSRRFVADIKPTDYNLE